MNNSLFEQAISTLREDLEIEANRNQVSIAEILKLGITSKNRKIKSSAIPLLIFFALNQGLQGLLDGCIGIVQEEEDDGFCLNFDSYEGDFESIDLNKKFELKNGEEIINIEECCVFYKNKFNDDEENNFEKINKEKITSILKIKNFNFKKEIEKIKFFKKEKSEKGQTVVSKYEKITLELSEGETDDDDSASNISCCSLEDLEVDLSNRNHSISNSDEEEKFKILGEEKNPKEEESIEKDTPLKRFSEQVKKEQVGKSEKINIDRRKAKMESFLNRFKAKTDKYHSSIRPSVFAKYKQERSIENRTSPNKSTKMEENLGKNLRFFSLKSSRKTSENMRKSFMIKSTLKKNRRGNSLISGKRGRKSQQKSVGNKELIRPILEKYPFITSSQNSSKKTPSFVTASSLFFNHSGNKMIELGSFRGQKVLNDFENHEKINIFSTPEIKKRTDNYTKSYFNRNEKKIVDVSNFVNFRDFQEKIMGNKIDFFSERIVQKKFESEKKRREETYGKFKFKRAQILENGGFVIKKKKRNGKGKLMLTKLASPSKN